jgi:hypothetical protein
VVRRYAKKWFATDISKVHHRYIKNSPQIYQKFTTDISKIHHRYIKNSPQIYQKFTTDISKIYPDISNLFVGTAVSLPLSGAGPINKPNGTDTLAQCGTP